MSDHGIASYSTLPPHMAQGPWLPPPPWESNGELAPPPHAQKWQPQFDDSWNGDPGIYADIPHGPEIDPGIYVDPAPADIDPGIRARPPYNAPSIVPGLDILRDAIETRGEPTTAPAPSAVGGHDGVAAMTPGDHVGGAARGFLLPSILGGAVGGIFAATSLARTGSAGAAFAGHFLGSAALGVATGAAAGLLVAATAPSDDDSLGVRYAVAGGVLGAAGGALFPMGPSRVIGAVGGAISGAIIAGLTGARMQRDAG